MITNETKLRGKFEHFLRSSDRCVDAMLKRKESGEYLLNIIEATWLGYQARAQEDATKLEAVRDNELFRKALIKLRDGIECVVSDSDGNVIGMSAVQMSTAEMKSIIWEALNGHKPKEQPNDK
jgi:phosphotransferase system IIB component